MKRKRSYILSLLALVLILCAFIQPAWAYFTSSKEATGAVPIQFYRETTIKETASGLTKDVTIENSSNSTTYVWVRARAYAGAQYELTYTHSANWEQRGDDGWWYYKLAVEPGGSTPKGSLKVTLDIGDVKPTDAVNVGVVYESITAFWDPEKNDFKAPTADDWKTKLEPYTGPTAPNS